MAKKATEVKVEEVKAVEVEAPKAETKKAPAKKEEATTEIVLQFNGQEVVVANVEETVKAQYVAEGHRVSSIKSLTVYVKPEEYSAYYVINGKVTGRVDLF